MRLKELRKEHGYTQAEVAERIGFTRSAYTNMEIGIREITVDTLDKLASLYGVTTDYLLGREKAPSTPEGEGRLPNDELTELERLFLSLSPDRREEVLRFMEFQASQSGKSEK